MAKINKREIEKQKRDEEDLEILCLIFEKACSFYLTEEPYFSYATFADSSGKRKSGYQDICFESDCYLKEFRNIIDNMEEFFDDYWSIGKSSINPFAVLNHKEKQKNRRKGIKVSKYDLLEQILIFTCDLKYTFEKRMLPIFCKDESAQSRKLIETECICLASYPFIDGGFSTSQINLGGLTLDLIRHNRRYAFRNTEAKKIKQKIRNEGLKLNTFFKNKILPYYT